jgi:uncharacterized MnhB-related membrane protein
VVTPLVVILILVCAVQAMRTARLLVAALWLAGTSALVALLIYLLGAPEVAVVELSVGAGLVTILFVFAINIAGDEPSTGKPSVPKSLVWVFVLVVVALLAWLSLPTWGAQLAALKPLALAQTLWVSRSLDTLLQLVLIFAAVLGVLGLLAESRNHPKEEKP